MKLVFVHIEEHLQLRNISVPLTSEFSFLLIGNELKITKNEDYIDTFYEGLNISAIIGKNGSGKTSILDFIESFYSNFESSGFFLFYDCNVKTFFHKTFNTNSLKYKLSKNIKDHTISHLISLPKNKIIKVNNISCFSANKNKSKKNVINLSSEKLSSNKKNRTKQLEYIFSYLKRKGTTYNSNIAYTFKFRGMTPALKNWIKESFISYLITIKYFKLNTSLFFSYLDESQVDIKEARKLLENLAQAKTQSEIPVEFEELISNLSNQYLQIISSKISNNDNLFYLIPPDFKYHNQTSGAILSKGIMTIFRKNIVEHKLESQLSSFIFTNLAYKIFNDSMPDKDNILDISFTIDDILSRSIEQFTSEAKRDFYVSKNELYENLKKLKHDIKKDFDIFIEVIRNIMCTKSIEVVEKQPALIPYNNHWQHEVINLTKEHLGFSSSELLFRYSGVEEAKCSAPLDITYISEEITKLPTYLQSSVDHGWEGLSSGEFAKTSLFSSIFNHLLSENTNDFQIFLIDEADLYLHPEWQRKFVFDLIELVKQLNFESKSQFIITTHSPLIIGDFLPEDILALNVEDGKPIVGSSLGFGTILSDFYLDGMHLDSTYGEHSRIKLQDMIDAKLKNVTLNKEQIKLVNKICNPALREALLDG